MPLLRCIIARTVREIMDAQRVRWRVYGDEERLLDPSVAIDEREIDARDHSEDTTHFVVYAGSEPVGTVRLLRASEEARRTESGCLGLDLGSKVDLGAFSGPALVPAEVTRFCVLRRYRCTRVTAALFAALRAASARSGITHWIAGANMETDVAEDAALAYRLVGEMKLGDEDFHAAPLVDNPSQTPRRRPYYTEEQRARARRGELAGLDLPRTLSLFATRMSARYISAPVYDTYFNVFALPLVAALTDVNAQRVNPRDLNRWDRPAPPETRPSVLAGALTQTYQK